MEHMQATEEMDWSEIDWENFTGTIVIDDPTVVYANNAPMFDFRCVRCGLWAESHSREHTIWNCPRCMCDESLAPDERMVPLEKKYRTSPSIPRVWHGHFNHTTGQYVTDRKQFREQLHVASEERSERLQFPHRFIEVDPSDRASLGVTEEGLDTTHDAHVKMGVKESKGRFVFPMSKGQ